MNILHDPPLLTQQFELVTGDILEGGKHWQVESTKLSNSAQALLVNMSLGDEVAVATLATRQPKQGESVIIVRSEPWEKSVRTDCMVDNESKREFYEFGLRCSDGPFDLGGFGSGRLIFSRMDGTLLGFGSGDSGEAKTVATSSILNDLPVLQKIVGPTQATPPHD
jgi:hypothetical protein